jgi:hypothetical protein
LWAVLAAVARPHDRIHATAIALHRG